MYVCGKELFKYDVQKGIVYQILVVDYDECFCARIYSDGEIEKVFAEHSTVPKKHRKGGQSAARFGRIRDTEITLWFKRINEYLKKIDGEIYVGISSIYYKRFFKTLDRYNQEKIKERLNSEYSDLSGIYQMINKLS